MSDVYTDGGTVYANLLAAGYDRFLEYQLRSDPVFRQFVDKHPQDVTNPGPTVTLSIMQQFASLHTTPLAETSDVAASAPPAPVRVTVTVNEYGNADVATLRLKQLAFTPPDPAIANLLGKDMVDSHDALVKAVVDGGTNIVGLNGGTVKTQNSGYAEGSVVHADQFNSALARTAVTLLRRRNAHGRDNADTYVALAHPDVVNDIISDTGWLAPHQYVNTDNIYNAEAGQYLGARYIMTPRATSVADGSSSEPVYSTYFLGAQAIVEATISEPHIVVGPQVDRLRRFFPIGWLSHLGWAIFRQEALQIAKSSSSVSPL